MKMKAILIIMFVVAGLVVPCLADFQTVGVYDPTDDPWNNDVDQSGVYSSDSGGAATAANVLVLSDIQGAVILDAFNAGMGGVVDLEGVGDALDGGSTIHAIYNVGGTAKTLDITESGGNGMSMGGDSDGGRFPISGSWRFVKRDSPRSFLFSIDGITDGGEPGEKVIAFGGTLISREGKGTVSVSVTATFSDGSTVTSTGTCGGNGTDADEDTFFGFVAPAGQYITQVNFNVAATWLHMDDIFFITDILPPFADAGPDQSLGLPDASTTGVVLDGTLSYYKAETYTYSWSGDFATIDDNDTTTAYDPTVTFDTVGDHVLTLNVTGSISGPLVADTVTITVTGVSVDAGPDQNVPGSVATAGVLLDATLSDPNLSEDFTYLWSGGFDTITDNNSLTAFDPIVTFPAGGAYVLTLNVTGDEGAEVSDTVTITVETNWTGATGGDWHTGTNWDTGAVPDPNAFARLGKETAEQPEFSLTIVNIDAAVDVKSIYIARDPNYLYTVNVNSGVSVTTTDGDIKIGDDGDGLLSALAGSIITIDDDLEVGDQGSGTFNMTGGELTVGDDIEISKDNDGTGTMTLIGVTVECDDLFVASNSDDGDGSGVGTVTLTDCDTTIDDGDLRIGAYGTGTVTATGGIITVEADDIEIGKRGTGTLTLNGTNIIGDIDKLMVGSEGGGYGELIMRGASEIERSEIETTDNVTFGGDAGNNDGSNRVAAPSTGILRMSGFATLIAGDQMRIGCDPNAFGYIYMTDPNTIYGDLYPLLATVNGEDLNIGERGYGFVETSGYIFVDDDMSVGKDNGGEGEIVMNTGAVLEVDGDLKFGNDGLGILTMNPTTTVIVKDNLSLGDEDDGYGELYMYVYGNDPNNDPNIVLTGTKGGGDLIVGNDGYGYLEMNGGVITIDDDMQVAKDDTGDGDVIMNGGTINVDDDIDFASHDNISGRDPVANLTMNSGALLTSGKLSGIGGDFDFARRGSGTLTMMSGATIDVGTSHAIRIGENSGSSAIVDIDDSSTRMFCEDLELGTNGGSVDFDIERARINIADHFLVANDLADFDDNPGTVNMVIDNNAYIDIGNKARIGGNNARVTITLLDGDINMNDGDDSFQMPDSDPNDGYSHLILGKDLNNISIGQAKFELDGPLDNHNAGARDYIDFLGGGLLETEVDPNEGVIGEVVPNPYTLTEANIIENIMSGYFRTSYSQADLHGEVPVEPNVFRVVYERKNSPERWHVYLGIGPRTGTAMIVPDVVGLAQATAGTDIVAAGLIVGAVTTADSTTVAIGDVISQDPTGDSGVAPGSAVDIVVSTGTIVPDVVGMTADPNAITAIEAAGLVAAATEASHPTVPDGDVISQIPTDGGPNVEPGSTVDIVVSYGVGVVVPNVLGDDEAAATVAIEAMGLVVGPTTYASHPTVPVDDVMGQNPVGSTVVKPGSTVDITLSTGPACIGPPAGDLNADCIVDLADLAILVGEYTTTYKLDDFAVLSEDWEKCGLESSCPPGTTPTEY